MTRRTEHTCHARGCSNPCPREHLMCPDCWALVPSDVQNRVYAAYQLGQCDFNPLPSADWHRAADEAVGAVMVAQGHITQEQADAVVERRYQAHLAIINAAEGGE